MNAEPPNSGTAGATRRVHSWLWPLGIATVSALLIYLYLVFMAAFSYSKPDDGVKPGRARPYYPDELREECSPIFEKTTMTPHADKNGEMHRFPGFQERGNVWLLNSARTSVYEAELLWHPRCLDIMLQNVAAARRRLILVIYDKATRSDVLVVRNY